MENQENQGKEAKKIIAEYDKNLKTLQAITGIGGKTSLSLVEKIPADDLGDIVREFVKEERESTITRVKVGLKAALKTKLDSDRAIAEEKKKFEAFELNKKKEFNNTVRSLLNEIDGIGKMELSYYKSLGGVMDDSKIDEKSTDENSVE